jgi:hypothetical protein
MRIGFLQGRRSATLTFGCLIALAASGFLVVGATACRRAAGDAHGLTFLETMAPQPLRVGAETIALHLADAQGSPVIGAKIQLEGDMAHPGMAPVFSDAKETAPGTYQAELNFNMPGDWVVLEHIRLADGTRIERQTDVRGVRAQ